MKLTPLKEYPRKVCDYITWNEAIRSYTATRKNIRNIPFEENLEQMILLAEDSWMPMRLRLGVPIYVASFFRSLDLNRELSNYPYTSQHLAMPFNTRIYGKLNDGGAAIDSDADVYGGATNKDIFFCFIDNEIPFDKLIWEMGDDKQPGWIHHSYRYGRNRGIIKRIYPDHREIILTPNEIERLR